MKKTILAAAAAMAMALEAGAMTTPFEISLLGSPVSIPWCDDVTGVRLNLLSGWNRNVYGLDVGTLVNIVDEKSAGLQVCGFYNHIGAGAGCFQAAGLWNRCDGDFRGLQLASVYNEVGKSLTGGAMAVMNLAKETRGFQLGVVNTTDRLVGMQLGIVNYVENAEKGVQVGLINIMPEANVPVSVLVNVGF